MGGFMRFLNHSCKPAAEFKEVSNRGRKTAVVATTRKIKRGDEVTVDYGGDLWLCAAACRTGVAIAASRMNKTPDRIDRGPNERYGEVGH
ncbi:hypothetical protein PF008_g8042 [Phytophthora fragariae]|uniref:SET domain-containing protein n=1 Tax=Phytophthora fragariae TaxID=53985 RepID=A0A6G0S2E4_9STRA|nr:hypothetical protein PF008_g8042 [Phytophthora fragariae]